MNSDFIKLDHNTIVRESEIAAVQKRTMVDTIPDNAIITLRGGSVITALSWRDVIQHLGVE